MDHNEDEDRLNDNHAKPENPYLVDGVELAKFAGFAGVVGMVWLAFFLCSDKINEASAQVGAMLNTWMH